MCVEKLLNPFRSNWRPTVQWYFPLRWVYSVCSNDAWFAHRHSLALYGFPDYLRSIDRHIGFLCCSISLFITPKELQLLISFPLCFWPNSEETTFSFVQLRGGADFFKGPTSASFIFYFRSISNNHRYNFFNKYMWKNVHPLYGAGIWTHDLRSNVVPITTRPGQNLREQKSELSSSSKTIS